MRPSYSGRSIGGKLNLGKFKLIEISSVVVHTQRDEPARRKKEREEAAGEWEERYLHESTRTCTFSCIFSI